MWSLKTNNKKTQVHRHREKIGGCQRWGGLGKIGEGGRKVQMPSYKLNKSWGCNV